MMHANLVLSGGGARGLAHLGVIKALREMDVYFNSISGVSSGAIAGAFIAEGYGPDETLEIIIESRVLQLLRPVFNDGLFRMDKMEETLLRYFPHNSFEKLKIPLIVSATDINEGHTDYFSSGELVKPLLASCALPVLFEPVMINKTQLLDGGILNNFPVEPFLEDDLALIGVHVNPWLAEERPDSAWKIMERSILLSIYGSMMMRKQHCQIFLEPDELKRFSIYDIDHAREIFKIGYQYAKGKADRLKSKEYC
jgi:NTE family protein